MRTPMPGAAKRRETTESVRTRMAQLLAMRPPGAPLPAGPEGEPSHEHPTGDAAAGETDGAGPDGDGFPRAGGSGGARGGEGRSRGAPAAGSREGGALDRYGPGVLARGPDLGPGPAAPAEPGGAPPHAPTEPGPGPGPYEAAPPLPPSPSRPLRLTLRPAFGIDRRAVLGLAVLLALAVAYAVQHFWLGRPETVEVPVAAAPTIRAGPETPGGPAGTGGSAGPAGDAAAAPTGDGVVVDIAGKVRAPGLRTLPGGSRVADALRAAGGALPDTDTSALNLARVLTDGEQILVGGPPVQPSTGPGARGPVNLNRATAEQLDALPGVGPTLAQRIIAYREAHGTFRSLDQLRQVSGVGDRTYAELRPLLTL